MNSLVRHLSASICWKWRHRFEKALHFRLRIEAPSCITFQSFLNDGSQRFITYEHFAAARSAVVAKAPRGLKYPMTVHRASAHPVFGLFGVLLTLVLRGARQHVLHEQAIGIFAEGDRRAFE
nr:hypothetical protein [uncultured Novosphingobium sp.]